MATTPLPPGSFIVLEGIDGAGTTTQTARLSARLSELGHRAHATCEPSRGPLGQYLRAVLTGADGAPRLGWESLALLFAADRLDHVQREIEPLLASGTTVVSDRYDLSSLAYQSATAPEGEAVLPWIRALNQRARRPDLTLVLEVAPELAAERRSVRGGAPELFDDLALQRRLASLYARAEELVPGDRVLHVPAHGSIEDVHATLLAYVLGSERVGQER